MKRPRLRWADGRAKYRGAVLAAYRHHLTTPWAGWSVALGGMAQGGTTTTLAAARRAARAAVDRFWREVRK